MSGFIKVARKMLTWEWYTDINVKVLFFHLLLKANWCEGRFQGYVVPRGSLVTSVDALCTETGLSIKQVRTAMAKLEKTGEVGKQTTSKFTIISITHYALYQDERQTKGNTGATIEEYKNTMHINTKRAQAREKTVNTQATQKTISAQPTEKKACVQVAEKTAFGEFHNVMLTKAEFAKLVANHGKEATLRGIEILGGYVASTGKRYASHYACFHTWVAAKAKEDLCKEALRAARLAKNASQVHNPRPTTMAQQRAFERDQFAKELLGIAPQTGLEGKQFAKELLGEKNNDRATNFAISEGLQFGISPCATVRGGAQDFSRCLGKRFIGVQ